MREVRVMEEQQRTDRSRRWSEAYRCRCLRSGSVVSREASRLLTAS